jgi:hypothetical protein
VAATSRIRKDRAGLVRVVADGHHLVERLTEIPVERLALLTSDVDPQLGHHGDGLRPHRRRDRAGAERLDVCAAECAQ